jgi:hypothetical protein
MTTKAAATTTIGIPESSKLLVEILQQLYGHMDAGTARAALESFYSPVWNEDEFLADFSVEETHAPYVTVVNRHTGQRGTAICLDAPRFYFLFNTDPGKD